MELKEAITKRQSIRRFKQGDVPDEDIKEIIKLTSKAPSAVNMQNWYFAAIKSAELKNKLSEAILKKNEEIAQAIEKNDEGSAAKFRKFCKNFTLFAANAPISIVVFSSEYIPMEKKYYEIAEFKDANKQIEHLMHVQNPGMQSLGAALNTFSLAAVEKGYGSCWLTSANYASKEIEAMLKNEIGFEKEGYYMAALLALGIPQEDQKSPGRKSIDDILTIIK